MAKFSVLLLGIPVANARRAPARAPALPASLRLIRIDGRAQLFDSNYVVGELYLGEADIGVQGNTFPGKRICVIADTTGLVFNGSNRGASRRFCG